ncbi:MAG: MFS transporter, partial [Gammaproteobacteria bacterium]|nr:MFS transporter [Gammaproteobacteria bacterium]
AALLAMIVLWQVGGWYKVHHPRMHKVSATIATPLPLRTVLRAMGVLMLLVFSKYFYLTSLTSYFTFYLMQKFQISVQTAQMHLFVFLFAVAAGTIIGGPLGDRIGRKHVIWASILGVAPFTLALPYANLEWTGILSFMIGFILASAFSAILVFAQELVPGKVGLVSGLFFGFAFGMGGIGAAVLGLLADRHGIEYVYRVCAYLPLLGLLTVFLPNIRQQGQVLN